METRIIQDQKNKELDNRIRFGIIGCSKIAKKAMLPAIVDSKIAKIGMIGGLTNQEALAYCKEFGCDSYGSYEDVIKNKEIDAVYISLPVGLHAKWAIKSAEAGKHVFCEKSSTTSFESAKQMIEACKKNNVRIIENFMFRYHPQQQKVINLISEKALGELLTFKGHFGFPFPEKENIRLKKELGGGVLNDAACYPVYASRFLFKEEPISVACNLKIDPQYDVDTKADLFLLYPNGKTAFVSAVFGAYFQSSYNLWGSKAFLSMKRAYAIPRDMKTSIFLDSGDNINELTIEPADQFKLILEDFCSELFIKEKSTKNFEFDLLAQAAVLEAARQSYKEKRIVQLSEFKL